MKKTIHVAIALCGVLSGCDPGGGPDGGRPGEDTHAPSQRILRRLTRFEYDNTIRDLLGLDGRWGQTFPPEEVVHGFDNNAAALRVGPLLFDKVAQAADEIAGAADLSRIVPCRAQPGDAETCARTFIESFGGRALRRPLSGVEADRYLALFRAAAATSFEDGIRTVLAAMLQSPHFLYRTELGRPQGDGTYRLTPYEVASELSYLLWGSMPDEELFARAKAGELATEEQLAAQVGRMLQSDRARPLLSHFVDQWLQLDRLAIVPKDEKVYPELTADLRAAMRAETTAFFDQVLRKEGAPVSALFTASYSLMSDALARFYGLQAAGPPVEGQPGLRRVDLTGSGRGGLLTHGSVLSVHATSHSSSPVHRGKLVRERLLCQDLPQPPPGLMVQLPAVDPKLSTRERFKAHAENPACSACHRLMDPIGFGFERFDGIGRLRMNEAGRAIDEGGEVVGAGGVTGAFTGVAELQARLAPSAELLDCFTLQWFRHAYGVETDEEMTALAKQAAERFRGGDRTFKGLLLALLRLDRFTVRAGDEGVRPPDQTPSPGPGMNRDMGGSGPGPGMNMDMGGGPPSPFTAAMKRDSDWATGYCASVTVQNGGAQEGDWSVTLDIEGTINNLWNAVSTAKSGRVGFSGQSYNKTLAPGASTSFGFCASK
jgi:hypothetical protein